MTTKTLRNPKQPQLRFSPTAWAKLLFLRDYGSTEIGAFGISAADDLLLVEEIELLPQRCSPVTVAFDDGAVADYFDRQVDEGRRPEQFARIWIHTHPGDCPLPSSVDERTFARVFGSCDWALMFILARGGQAYCRLHFRAGPGGDLLLKTQVEYQHPFLGTDHEAWEQEYHAHVRRDDWPLVAERTLDLSPPLTEEFFSDACFDPWDESAHHYRSV